MSQTIEVKVPDIGDFKDVPIIEVLVKPGDSIKPEDPLITLESEKATMDVPSPSAGTVNEVKVKPGDKVSEGSVILSLETKGEAASPRTSVSSSAEPPRASPSPPVGEQPCQAPAARSGFHDV